MKCILQWLFLSCIVFNLTGCASVKRTPYITKHIKSRGGYYQNDGPADYVPANLGSLPDAEPKEEELIASANKPYSALGKKYYPDTSDRPYSAKGKASWYGKQFHGRKTASGEKYDMFAMTAAHPTMPIPSYARVTNLKNGKSVIVRINDRGPFHKSRVMDLSYAAAYKLAFINQGSANVKVERVFPAEDSSTSTMVADLHSREIPINRNEAIFLQIGAFSQLANAESCLRDMMSQLDGKVDRKLSIVNNEGLFKIRLGPFNNKDEAKIMAELLNIESSFVYN